MEKTKISPKKLPVITVASIAQIGALAPQLKNGESLIAISRSFSSSNVLVAIIAGTEHPKPIKSGMKALPDKPNFLNALSIIKATRAIYPESSRIDIKKNNSKICGKKLKIASKPESKPSQIKPVYHVPSGIIPDTKSIIDPVNQPIQLCKNTPSDGIPANTASSP